MAATGSVEKLAIETGTVVIVSGPMSWDCVTVIVPWCSLDWFVLTIAVGKTIETNGVLPVEPPAVAVLMGSEICASDGLLLKAEKIYKLID